MAHLALIPACKRITLVVCMCERRAREREGEGWGVRANLCCRLNRLFVQQVSVYTEVTEEDTLTHTPTHTLLADFRGNKEERGSDVPVACSGEQSADGFVRAAERNLL